MSLLFVNVFQSPFHVKIGCYVSLYTWHLSAFTRDIHIKIAFHTWIETKNMEQDKKEKGRHINKKR